MKQTIFCTILISSLILFSCQKDDQLAIEKFETPLLSKVVVDGKTLVEYSYNTDNLLSEEKNKFYFIKHNYSDKDLFATSDFHYNFSLDSTGMNAWVNAENTPKSLSKVFEYVDNDKFRIVYSRPGDNTSEFSEFTYDKNRIVKQTMYLDNKISGHLDYSYDEAGNLIKKTKYVITTGDNKLMTTTVYEYDDKPNPFYGSNKIADPGINTNRNNITKETYTIHYNVSPSIEKVQVTQNQYAYNEKGYPVKNNGNIEFKYIYR
jgi:hypothetical protein